MTALQAPSIIQKIRNTYHEYPRPFWVLIGGTFIDVLGTNLILPFMGIYVAKRFNAPMTQVAIIFTIFAITGAAGNMLAGALADRFGRRSAMILGLVCAATARIGLGLANDFPALYIAAGFAGFFGAISRPAQAAMTADILEPEKRADGFGIQRVVVNISWVLGPLAGGFLAPVIGYLALFIIDAITSYITAGIVFAMLPETKPERKAGEAHETFTQTITGYGQVLRDKVFVVFTLISILMVSAYLQMYVTLSVYLVRFEKLPESFYGGLLMTNSALVVLFQFPLTRWSSKRPPMLIMIGGTALYLVGLLMYGVTSFAVLFVIAMALISIGESLVMPTGQALTALLAPENMRARYAAMAGFTWIIPQALAPLAAGVIMDQFDPRWVWYGCAILCAVSMAGFYGLHLRVGGRLEQAEPSAITAATSEGAAAD